MRVVMPTILPSTAEQPYLCMARFGAGASGDPHFHVFSIGAGVPRLERVNADLGVPTEEGDAPALADDDGADFDVQQVLLELEGEMLQAAESLEFERAAVIRDQVNELKHAEGLTEGSPKTGKKKKKMKYKRSSKRKRVSAE